MRKVKLILVAFVFLAISTGAFSDTGQLSPELEKPFKVHAGDAPIDVNGLLTWFISQRFNREPRVWSDPYKGL